MVCSRVGLLAEMMTYQMVVQSVELMVVLLAEMMVVQWVVLSVVLKAD